MTSYFATITNVATDEFVTYTYGGFSTMNFAMKAGLKEIADKSGDFAARIVEVDALGVEPGEDARVVVSVQGDAETVAVVAKKKIARERKANAPADETPAETDSDSE